MNYSFVNKPAVKADIINAINYYSLVSPKLAKQFLFRIKEAKIYIKRSPLAFQIKYKDVRTLLLKQFPFQIHYLIDDERSKSSSLRLSMLTETQQIIQKDKSLFLVCGLPAF